MNIKTKLYGYGTLPEDVTQLFQFWLSEYVKDVCEEAIQCFGPEDFPGITKYEVTVRQINLTDKDKETIKEIISSE